MWFPYNPPADSSWSTQTITTRGLPGWPGPGAEAGRLPTRVWFPLPPLPLLPNWLCADEGKDSASVRVEVTARDCWLWAHLAAHLGFTCPLKKGSSLLVWAAASKQVWVGVGEETLTKNPLLSGGLSTYRCALFDAVGLETIRVCPESLLIQCFPAAFQCCFFSSPGLYSVQITHLIPLFLHWFISTAGFNRAATMCLSWTNDYMHQGNTLQGWKCLSDKKHFVNWMIGLGFICFLSPPRSSLQKLKKNK